MSVIVCQAGHESHDVKRVEVGVGAHRWQMDVWDAEQYRDTPGYCTGDDAVSRSLTDEGEWEHWNTKMLLDREVFQGGLVFDLGAHIGWYSVLSARSGCMVYAVEGNPLNVQLLVRNVCHSALQNRVFVERAWVDAGWHVNFGTTSAVDLIKCDLEGKDREALAGVWPWIGSGVAKHLMVECSPVFAPGYPELVDSIIGHGYRAEVVDQEPFDYPGPDWLRETPQVDLFFTKVDT